MKRKKVYALTLLCAGLLLAGGCGKIPKLSNGDEAVVTFKDDKKISVNDLYNKMKEDYALEPLVTLIDLHILEDEFADYVEEAKAEAESQIKTMEEQYGDKSQLLQALQYYTKYATIEAYQESIYLSYMQSHATEEYAKLQITDKQIEEYYNKEAVGDIEISHILITPEAEEDDSDEIKDRAEEDAKKLAKDIISQLKTAKKNKEDITAKFTELAKKYSEDDATKDKGGALGKFNKNTLDETYDELIDTAYELKDGEFSTSLITTEQGYEIVMRTKSYEKESLKDLKESIIERLSEKLIETDTTVAIDALDYYRTEYKMEIQDSELKKQYDNYLKTAITNAANADVTEE